MNKITYNIINEITSKQLLNSIRLRFQFFPSHLVERSIWPLFLSFSLFSLAISAVQYMHGYSTGFILLRASIVLTIFGMGLWWKDVIIEATFLGNHTKKVKEGILQGFILFVISEIMVFLSVFWAYAHSSLSPALEIGGCWPKIVIFIFCYYLFNFTKQLKFFQILYTTEKTVSKPNNTLSSYFNASLNKVIAEFNIISNNFNPSSFNLNPNDFKKFINGLFQAEGTITAYFKKSNSLRLGFYFAIGQNFTPEAANVLLLLQHYLCGIGKFKFEKTISGNIHIKFVVTNKDDIFKIVIPYFTYLYGDKKFAFIKLEQIYQIINNLLNGFTTELAYNLITLVYSLNPDGNSRKLSLTEKLNLFNIFIGSFNNNLLNNIQDIKDNNNLPDILFIIGLFIGDGSLYYGLEVKTFPKFYVRIICDIVSLKNSVYNKHLLTLIAESLGLPKNIYLNKNNNLITLKYRGNVVFKNILILFLKNIQW